MLYTWVKNGVYIHFGQAEKICLITVGIEPMTFGMLAKCSAKVLSYAVSSVRACDISSLVPSISISIPKVVGSTLAVVRHIFQLAQCGYIDSQ